MNSGYQTIDLSKDKKIFAKAKSAFTLGLPVLVKTLSGVVSFASVSEGEVESDTVYNIDFVNDNKLYRETIADDNTVTESSIDLSEASGDIEDIITELGTITNDEETGRLDTLESDVEDIEERLDATVFSNTYTQIQSYNSTDNTFVAPTDGYFCYAISSNDMGGENNTSFRTKNGSFTTIKTINSDGKDFRDLLFVKKDMEAYFTLQENTIIYFMSLVNE